MGKWCLHASLFLGNKDMFKNYKRFDFWQVQTADIGGIKPWKNNCSLIWKLFKFLMTLLAGLFIKVAGNQDRHKSSVEFGPLVSMAHLYVFLNEIWPWHIGLRWAMVSVSVTPCTMNVLSIPFQHELWPWPTFRAPVTVIILYQIKHKVLFAVAMITASVKPWTVNVLSIFFQHTDPVPSTYILRSSDFCCNFTSTLVVKCVWQ